MIARGALCPRFNPYITDDKILTLTATQIYNPDDGVNRRLSIIKWPAKYFSGRNGLEARLQTFCSSIQGFRETNPPEIYNNFLWEQEPNLGLVNWASLCYFIVWIQSDNEKNIQQSFARLAGQLGICRDDGDDEYDPALPSKVYHCIPEYLRARNCHPSKALIIFNVFKPEGKSLIWGWSLYWEGH